MAVEVAGVQAAVVVVMSAAGVVARVAVEAVEAVVAETMFLEGLMVVRQAPAAAVTAELEPAGLTTEPEQTASPQVQPAAATEAA